MTVTDPVNDQAVSSEKAPPGNPRLAAASVFVQRVRALDRGELATLKRNAGNTLAQARGVAWFYRLLDDDARRRDTEIFFLVATLIGLNKFNAGGDFGASMRQLAASHGEDSVKRRFGILLDSQFDLVDGYRPTGGELAYRLRQMVKLAAAKEVGVSWPQLLLDLRQWTRPDKRVQRKWAESFYAPGGASQPIAATASGESSGS
jgi:CRISPR system Cascade subunit CasB